MNKRWLISLGFLFVFLFVPSQTIASDYPKLANYYLGEIKSDSAFLANLARYDLLILTPDQIDTHRELVKKLRAINPQLIILAYVPSQSFNVKYWDRPWSVFRHLRPIDDSWWLRDSSGAQIFHWNDLANLNMDPAWSRHLVGFIKQWIESPEVDGVFFDMVSDCISWTNGGNTDLNNDGVKDVSVEVDKLWLERVEYLLDYAQQNLSVKYIVINGSPNPRLQSYVNGRMFENFPKAWNNSGEWGKIMNSWASNQKKNLQPLITIINTNTANTGKQDNYRLVRYGLASSLLLDGYFSFDYGDENHGQVWWYDEYDVNLGQPTNQASSVSGFKNYQADVWRRDFSNGVVLVNSTGDSQQVDLGGEFEKIRGTQDKTVNDGAIVSETSLGSYDGQILLKTISTLSDVVFRNGDFVRFLGPKGERVRNGFFVFDSKYQGGDLVAYIDLDGNGLRDVFIASKGKIEAWRDDGQLLLRAFPYGLQYHGDIRVALGDLSGDGKTEVAVAPAPGKSGSVKLYQYDNIELKETVLPFKNTYKGGMSVAIGDDKNAPRLVVGSGQGKEPRVFVYDNKFKKVASWNAFSSKFLGGVSVAAGNVDGIPGDEIIVGAGKGAGPLIRVFNFQGKLLYPEFKAYQTFAKTGIEVLAVDVNFDGKDEIIAQSSGF